MSEANSMPERSLDWLKQAEKDIEKAKLDIDGDYEEWSFIKNIQRGKIVLDERERI
jgi:hypothetical protein